MYPDALVSMTRMISSLAIVIGVIVLIMALFKRFTASGTLLGTGFKLIRTISSVPIAPKKSIALIEVAGEVIAVAITGQEIAMLYKIENEIALEKIRSAESAKVEMKSFRDYLRELKSHRLRFEIKGKRSPEEAR